MNTGLSHVTAHPSFPSGLISFDTGGTRRPDSQTGALANVEPEAKIAMLVWALVCTGVRAPAGVGLTERYSQ